MFRSQMISFFKIAYEFYEVHPEEPRDISRFIQENFKQLIGKTYRPSDMNESFILAVSNDDKSIVSEIRKKAAVKPYDLE